MPRSLLQEFIKRPESGQVALYFLIGDEGDGTDPEVYLGQTGDLRTRLVSHNQKKDFWQACAGPNFSHKQLDPDARTVSGVVLLTGREDGRPLRRSERQQWQQAAYASPARSRLSGDVRDG